LSEALPERGHALHMSATPSPCADPCSVVETNDTSAYALALAEALRKKRGSTETAPEVVDAQESLERRIRAHLTKGADVPRGLWRLVPLSKSRDVSPC